MKHFLSLLNVGVFILGLFLSSNVTLILMHRCHDITACPWIIKLPALRQRFSFLSGYEGNPDHPPPLGKGTAEPWTRSIRLDGRG